MNPPPTPPSSTESVATAQTAPTAQDVYDADVVALGSMPVLASDGGSSHGGLVFRSKPHDEAAASIMASDARLSMTWGQQTSGRSAVQVLSEAAHLGEPNSLSDGDSHYEGRFDAFRDDYIAGIKRIKEVVTQLTSMRGAIASLRGSEKSLTLDGSTGPITASKAAEKKMVSVILDHALTAIAAINDDLWSGTHTIREGLTAEALYETHEIRNHAGFTDAQLREILDVTSATLDQIRIATYHLIGTDYLKVGRPTEHSGIPRCRPLVTSGSLADHNEYLATQTLRGSDNPTTARSRHKQVWEQISACHPGLFADMPNRF